MTEPVSAQAPEGERAPAPPAQEQQQAHLPLSLSAHRFVPRLEGDEAPAEEWTLSYADIVTLLLTMFVALLLNVHFDLPSSERAGYGREGSGPASGTSGGDGSGLSGGTANGSGSGAGAGNGGGTGGRNFFETLFQLRVETPYGGEQAIGLTVPTLPGPIYTQPDATLAMVKENDLERIRQREAIIASVRASLVAASLDTYITATQEGDGVRLNIPNSILFESGAAELQGRGPNVIKALAPVLIRGNFVVTVEGHTDDQAISTARYPSNWDLSASRAAAVVRTLAEAGMEPRRLEAAGYADSRPLTSNESEAGRRENRRVTLLLRAP